METRIKEDLGDSTLVESPNFKDRRGGGLYEEKKSENGYF